MIDSIRKTLFAGLGAGVVTYDKLEAVLQDLVDRGKLSAEDAKSTAARMAEESRAEFQESRKSLESMLNDLLAKAPFVRKSDMAALELRVAALEAQLAELTAAKADKKADAEASK